MGACGRCCHLAVSLQIDYPEIAEGIMPRHRFMSAYEQRIEPPDRRWQYLLMAAEPYETIAFKVRGPPVPRSPLRQGPMRPLPSRSPRPCPARPMRRAVS